MGDEYICFVYVGFKVYICFGKSDSIGGFLAKLERTFADDSVKANIRLNNCGKLIPELWSNLYTTYLDFAAKGEILGKYENKDTGVEYFVYRRKDK